MDISRKSGLSRRGFTFLLAACTIPLHIWAFIDIFRQIPALMMRMNIWDVLGVTSYILLFVLVETLLLFLFILVLVVLLHLILPRIFTQAKMVAFGTITAILITLWLIFLQVRADLFSQNQIMSVSVWVGSLIIVISLGGILIHLSERISNLLNDIVAKFVVLGIFYLVIDALAILNIIARNFIGTA